MSHSFGIDFNPAAAAARAARATTLDRVITPVDSFTGRIVTTGVTAYVAREDRYARRSLSGHLVFEGLVSPAPIRVEIDAGRAGYFSPPPLDFADPQAFDPTEDPAEIEARLRIRKLPLVLRPDAVRDGEAAVIRGGIRREGAWIAGAVVTGTVDLGGGDTAEFETLTDVRGSFALRVRLRPEGDLPGPVAVPVTGTVALSVAHAGDDFPQADVGIADLTTTSVGVIDLPDP